MWYRLIFAAMLATCAMSAVPASAQALGGTYTCANGNPGGAFDYADIGDFFNDLEEYGVNAPVVLRIYDDGGPFLSKESYLLGLDGQWPTAVLRPVAGLGPANTLSISAALGESPQILGGGAVSHDTTPTNTKGAMAFHDVSYTTIQGIEFTGGDFGVHWAVYSPLVGDQIRVSRCKFHGISRTSAIAVVAFSTVVSNVTFENNVIWDCHGGAGGLGTFGVVSIYSAGANCVVRHNTIVHLQGTGPYLPIYYRGETHVLSELIGNIIVFENSSQVPAVSSNGLPAFADYNVIHVLDQAVIASMAPNWASWQAAVLDPNGLNTDPLLVSVAPGSEDLRLRPDSPAVDLIPSGGPALDVFGNPRPYGSGFDAGAHELQNFGARAGLPASSALVGPSGGPFSITLDHGDALADVAIQLSDPEAEDITVSSITASAALAGVAAPAIPAPSHPLTLAWSGFIENTNPPGIYTWVIEFADAGTGFVMTCEVSITVTTPPPVALHTPNPLPAGRVAQDYSLALQATGTGTLVFSLLSGDLPSGLSLSATGQITGTPGTDGEYTFTVQAADNFTKEQQDYEISIKPKPPPDTGSGSCSVSMAQRGRGGSSPANRALALAALVFFIGTLALARRRR